MNRVDRQTVAPLFYGCKANNKDHKKQSIGEGGGDSLKIKKLNRPIWGYSDLEDFHEKETW